MSLIQPYNILIILYIMIKKYIAGNSIKCVLNISKEVMKINKIPVIK